MSERGWTDDELRGAQWWNDRTPEARTAMLDSFRPASATPHDCWVRFGFGEAKEEPVTADELLDHIAATRKMLAASDLESRSLQSILNKTTKWINRVDADYQEHERQLRRLVEDDRCDEGKAGDGAAEPASPPWEAWFVCNESNNAILVRFETRKDAESWMERFPRSLVCTPPFLPRIVHAREVLDD